MGKVDDGTTVSDYDPEETKRHISISAAVAPFEWNGTKVNLIDAPGFFDFYGEVYEAIALADSAIIVCGGFQLRCRHRKSNEHVQKGKYAPNDRHQPDSDRKRKRFDKAVEGLHDKFGVTCVPIQLPVIEKGAYVGYVDLTTMTAKRFDGKGEEIDIPLLSQVVPKNCAKLLWKQPQRR